MNEETRSTIIVSYFHFNIIQKSLLRLSFLRNSLAEPMVEVCELSFLLLITKLDASENCNDGLDDILLTLTSISLMCCLRRWCEVVVVMGTFSFLCKELDGGVEADRLPRFSFEELFDELVFVESLVCKANKMSSWFLVGRHNASCIWGTS